MSQKIKKFTASWKKTIQKAYLQMLILYTLSVLDNCTGYTVTEQLRSRISSNIFKISAGTIYPQLNKLEQFGLVQSEMRVLSMAEIRPSEPRKIFILTNEGKKITKDVSVIWIELVNTADSYLLEIRDQEKELGIS
ncbi:MAG: PadR family transcriptional regulator [Candidatus Hodarchaeales archaeon]|jgi:DNA-binding PadR family transcriptional regulator